MSFQPLCYRPDLVFEGRNKAYGAYVLRKIYEKRIMTSVIAAIVLFAIAMGGPVLYYRFAMAEEKKENLKKLEMKALEPPPVDKKTPPPPVVPPPPPPPPQVASIKFLPPEPDKEVKEDEMPPIEKVKENNISDKTQEGDNKEAPPTVEEVVTAPAVVEAPKEDPNQIYTVVQQQPTFPGGQEGIAKFLRKNFKYPRNAQRMGIEGKVFVRFVVRKDGKVDDVSVIRGIANCNECNDEAVRLVRMMPNWSPGMQNGNAVNVYYSLPITFKIQD
jgi:protein TonB